jgi:hypothetical protein
VLLAPAAPDCMLCILCPEIFSAGANFFAVPFPGPLLPRYGERRAQGADGRTLRCGSAALRTCFRLIFGRRLQSDGRAVG